MSLAGTYLDPLDIILVQTEIEHIEIRPHVVGVSGPGERDHAYIKSEAEDDLADRPIVSFCDSHQF
ncbi:MAG TPA: hypothetical protein VMV69_06465 [Pirellulales bacterium]|nr:hypothetical protein [Pirellulales bacterium]